MARRIKETLGVVLLLLALPLSAQNRPPLAPVTIQVKVPPNTPQSDTIWIFPGQLFNVFSPHVPMSRVAGTSDTWETTISAPVGTILRYEFARNDDFGKLETYAAFGPQGYLIELDGLRQNQAPIREVFVQSGVTIREAVAQWSDLPLSNNSTGTLTGKLADVSGKPLPGIWVSAGPHRTMTDTSGAFQIYGVPAGPCTITAQAENGEFAVVSMAISIPPNGSVVQDLLLTRANMSNVTFTVTVPPDTPANGVPLLFGDTYRLGMVSLAAMEPDTTRYIAMSQIGPNRWSFTTQLGDGVCVNYLYTLGHRILNYENGDQANLITRSLCVNGPVEVSDSVNFWKSSIQVPVTLTVTSPTGTEDAIFVTTDGSNGQMPVKMWPTGPSSATYTLYVNPNTILKYRYLRNGDTAYGMEIVGTDSNPPAYRSITVGTSAVSRIDTITEWRHQMREPALSTVGTGITGPAVSRSSPFQSGIEVADSWKTNWLPLAASTMKRIKSMNAEWVQIPAVWTPVLREPPIKGEFIPAVSFPPQDLIADIRAAKAAGLHIALNSLLYPPNYFGPHSTEWFDQFFAQFQSFALFNANIAMQEGAEMLILSAPVFDADVNDDVAMRRYLNSKWKAIIAAIRASGYKGKLCNDALTFYRPEYDWLADLDYLGDRFWLPVAASDGDSVQSMYDQTIRRLITFDLPIVNRFHKPLIFTQVAFYSARSSALQTYDIVYSPEISDNLPADPTVQSDYDEQARAYQAVMLALASTSWVQGAYSFGYSYFNLDSKGFSIRAKTAEQIVGRIYKQINETTPSNTPVITSVNMPGGFPVIAQNSWIEIKGTNLAPPSVGPNGITWSNAPEFGRGLMPTQLEGVSVTVNGKPAFVYYVSAAQVNVLTPLDDMTGTAQVVVTRTGTASLPFFVNMSAAAPTSLQVGSTNYVLATHADYSLIGPASLSVPGYPFSPARPGERIILWATGLGLPTDTVVNGSSSQSGSARVRPGIRIGGIDAATSFAAGVSFAGLSGPGLYQVNITVPPEVPDGDNKVTWFYQQQASQVYPPGALIAIQR